MGKIMCVDDSSTIRNLIRNTLSIRGWSVIEAENGVDALKKVTSDIVFFIVDVNMPQMDGFEFVKRLKAETGHKSTPVVFLTTESSDEKKQKGKSYGVNGWIVKPFEEETLIKIIDILVD